MKSLLLFACCAIFISSSAALRAQNNPKAQPTTDAGKVIGKFSLGLARDEASRDNVAVPIENVSEKPLKIDAVQTSGNFFVKDFSKNIPPHGVGTVTLSYVAQPLASGNVDVLRVLTDDGEKIVQLEHGREEFVSVDTTKLDWALGDNTAKAFTITVRAAATIPKAARVMGKGNQATIQSLGSGQFRVSVQPAPTGEPRQFPVFIDFDPVLPGVTVTVTCNVGVKS